MGKHLLAAYRTQAPADDDPGIVRRLDTVYQGLCGGIATRRRSFRVEGSLEPATNACAFPGGIIIVTRPLLDLCAGDDDALAFVIAHEMGHIVRNHAADRFLLSATAKTIARWVPGGNPLSTLLRDQLVQLMTQGYSRDQEFEADAYGIRLVRAAGYKSDAAVRLLGKLDRPEDDGFSYYQSHPPMADRIRAIQTCCPAPGR